MKKNYLIKKFFSNEKSKFYFAAVIVIFAGCASFQRMAFMAGEAAGNDLVMKATGDMTPQQEYYLGRSIAARVVSAKPLVKTKHVQAYVNFVGQYLAMHSDRPDLFVGYRFAVVDDDTVTAVSTPGGFVLISKGLLKLTQNEDELAAVLAHEIAHVAQGHSQKNIKNQSQLKLGKEIVQGLANDPNNKDLKQLTDSIEMGLDITFNKDQEVQADSDAVSILRRAGYAPIALKTILDRIPENNDILSKHPRSEARLEKVNEMVDGSELAAHEERLRRFVANTKL